MSMRLRQYLRLSRNSFESKFACLHLHVRLHPNLSESFVCFAFALAPESSMRLHLNSRLHLHVRLNLNVFEFRLHVHPYLRLNRRCV